MTYQEGQFIVTPDLLSHAQYNSHTITLAVVGMGGSVHNYLVAAIRDLCSRLKIQCFVFELTNTLVDKWKSLAEMLQQDCIDGILTLDCPSWFLDMLPFNKVLWGDMGCGCRNPFLDVVYNLITTKNYMISLRRNGACIAGCKINLACLLSDSLVKNDITFSYITGQETFTLEKLSESSVLFLGDACLSDLKEYDLVKYSKDMYKLIFILPFDGKVSYIDYSDIKGINIIDFKMFVSKLLYNILTNLYISVRGKKG